MASRESFGSFLRVNRWLMVGLVALGAAVYLSTRYVSEAGLIRPAATSGPAPATTPVVVARVSLPAYSAVSATALEVEQVPAADVPPGALTSLSQAKGLWTSESVAVGVPLVASAVFSPKSANILASRIHPGNMAIDLPLPANDVVDGLVEPGDTISLFATITEKNGQQAAEDFLNQVKVLAVNGSMAASSTPTTGQNLNLILALPPGQVAQLLFMHEKGPVEAVLDAPNARTHPPLPYTISEWQHPVP